MMAKIFANLVSTLPGGHRLAGEGLDALLAFASGPVPDLFDLDGIAELMIALEVYFVVQAALLAFIIAVAIYNRLRSRSPVERLIRRRRFGV